MICTYIFEDKTGQLGRWARSQNPDRIIRFSTLEYGGLVWRAVLYTVSRGGDVSLVSISDIDLVSAVVTAPSSEHIDIIKDCLGSCTFFNGKETEMFSEESLNMLYLPRNIIGEITIDKGYSIDFYTKPGYVTPLLVDEKNDFVVSGGDPTAYYMVSTVSVVGQMNYRKYGKEKLVSSACKILEENNVAHTRNKPYATSDKNHFVHTSAELENVDNKAVVSQYMLNQYANDSSKSERELVCNAQIFGLDSLKYYGNLEDVTPEHNIFPWLYTTFEEDNLREEIFYQGFHASSNTEDSDHSFWALEETFGVYTDSALANRCAQTVNAWEKSSGLTFGDL